MSFLLDVNNTIISYSTHDKRLEVVFYTEWNRGMISLSGQLLHCYVFTVPILACFVGLHSALRATGSIFFLCGGSKKRDRETPNRQTHKSD